VSVPAGGHRFSIHQTMPTDFNGGRGSSCYPGGRIPDVPRSHHHHASQVSSEQGHAGPPDPCLPGLAYGEILGDVWTKRATSARADETTASPVHSEGSASSSSEESRSNWQWWLGVSTWSMTDSLSQANASALSCMPCGRQDDAAARSFTRDELVISDASEDEDEESEYYCPTPTSAAQADLPVLLMDPANPLSGAHPTYEFEEKPRLCRAHALQFERRVPAQRRRCSVGRGPTSVIEALDGIQERLTISVLRGDSLTSRRTLGELNCYVILRVGTQKIKTAPARGSCPSWQHESIVEVEGGVTEVLVEVWDRKSLRPDRMVGRQRLALEHITAGCDDGGWRQTVVVTNDSGELTGRVHFEAYRLGANRVIHVPRDAATISEALSIARPHTIIKLASGEYHEDVTITTRGVGLVANEPTESPIIRGVVVVEERATGAYVKYLVVRPDATHERRCAVVLAAMEAVLAKCFVVVPTSVAPGESWTAVCVRGGTGTMGTFCSIRCCEVQGGTCGIRVAIGGLACVSRCRVTGALNTGIVVDGMSSAELRQNIVSENGIGVLFEAPQRNHRDVDLTGEELVANNFHKDVVDRARDKSTAPPSRRRSMEALQGAAWQGPADLRVSSAPARPQGFG